MSLFSQKIFSTLPLHTSLCCLFSSHSLHICANIRNSTDNVTRKHHMPHELLQYHSEKKRCDKENLTLKTTENFPNLCIDSTDFLILLSTLYAVYNIQCSKTSPNLHSFGTDSTSASNIPSLKVMQYINKYI